MTGSASRQSAGPVRRGESTEAGQLVALAERAMRQGAGELLRTANELRREHFDRGVRLCSIAAGKIGSCPEDCAWCAQSLKHATSPQPVRYSGTDEILRAADKAVELGAGRLGIVNSGRRPSDSELERVVAAAEAIRRKHPADELRICASLGELSSEQASRLAESPVDRYHHNLETSAGFFTNMVHSHTYQGKLDTISHARQAGLEICCGGLFGLGESWMDRVELAIRLRDEIQPQAIPMNFLMPIPGTPLENRTPISPEELLITVSIYRLILPRAEIKIAGGRQHAGSRQERLFEAGANGFMIGDYLTTTGRSPQEDLRMLADLGMTIER